MATTWTESLTELLEDISGGLEAKIRRMAESAPVGPAEVFAAWRLFSDALGRIEDKTDWPRAAWEFCATTGGEKYGDALADLARALIGRVQAALAAGANDDRDRIVLESDFGKVTRIGGGRWQGFRVGVLDTPHVGYGVKPTVDVPKDSPLREIPAFTLADHSRVLLLDSSQIGNRPWYRLSKIARYTAAAVEQARFEEAERERVAEEERRMRLVAAEKLERQAAALRGEPVGGGGWSAM